MCLYRFVNQSYRKTKIYDLKLTAEKITSKDDYEKLKKRIDSYSDSISAIIDFQKKVSELLGIPLETPVESQGDQ